MWQDFFSQAYKLPLLVLRRAMANPMGLFVYGILSKWYILVMIATISVTFWVFKGLEQAGVIDAITKELKYGFLQAQAVAQKCTPKIMNLADMYDCIQHTSGDDFRENDDEKALRNTLKQNLQDGQGQPFNNDGNAGVNGNSTAPTNPYDTPIQPTAPPVPTAPDAPAPRENSDGVNRI